ncbi:head-tail joining protein [Pseudomonas ovata]|uniref:head-tail joining protein n=1 Tax=Pseudomonas ovata TaxID=1839709 RepID=UPI000D695541|nr:hypothetical protein [Pseudomonas ovata]
MAFRDQVAAMDQQLLDALGDDALIEGRPVPGFLTVTWLQPKLGQLRTGLREPTYSVRITDVVGIAEGQNLICQLAPEDGGGRYVITRCEPDGTGWINLVLREVR